MDYRDLKVTECLLGNDGEMLCFALDRVRKEFAWKTGGLDVEQLRRRHPPSMMTLAGLINTWLWLSMDSLLVRKGSQIRRGALSRTPVQTSASLL